MKISASKKTIIILSISFSLLLLASISFLFRDAISNGFNHGRWFVLDKYERLLEDCDYVKKGKAIKVQCNALLYPAPELEKNLNTHCYNFLTIPIDNEKKLYLFNICEGNNKVKWEEMSEWLKADSLVPVRYSILFERSKLFSFKYSGLEIENVNEKEYYNEFHKNKDLVDRRYVVSLDKAVPDQYFNYISMDRNTLGIEEVGHIYLFDTQLENIEAKGEELQYTFSSTVEEEDVVFTIPSKHILLQEREGQFTAITAENKEVLKLNSKYQLQFFYLSNKSDAFVEKIKKTCSQEVHGHLESLCINIDTILEDSFKQTNKDEVIKEILSKGDGGVLNNTILFYMISK